MILALHRLTWDDQSTTEELKTQACPVENLFIASRVLNLEIAISALGGGGGGETEISEILNFFGRNYLKF